MRAGICLRWAVRGLIGAMCTASPGQALADTAYAGITTGKCAESEVFALAVHVGAITRMDELSVEARRRVVEAGPAYLRDLLRQARVALKAGATALDAVETTIATLEDSGAFNAGRGAIANRAGDVETDASIMDGRTLDAGAIAAVRTVKNPIRAARIVMEKSPHVMMVGPDGEAYVHAHGADRVEPSYFIRSRSAAETSDTGTVGTVALDRCGNLAAGTSTGGWTGKTPGRVGDSPIIGAGTYANNATMALSATGHGEFFIRFVVAHEVSALIEHRGLPLEQAVQRVIHATLGPGRGDGGVIAIDAQGHVAASRNTEAMPRGFVTHDQEPQVEIY